MTKNTKRLYTYLIANGQPGASGIRVQTTAQQLKLALGLSLATIYRCRKQLIDAAILTVLADQYLWLINEKTQYAAEVIFSKCTEDTPIEMRNLPMSDSENSQFDNEPQRDYNDAIMITPPKYNRSTKYTRSTRCKIGGQVTSYLKPKVYNRSLYMANEQKTDQKPKAPKLPVKVSEVVELGLEFPLPRLAVQSSAVWYWALRRYEKYGIDFQFTTTNFRSMAIRYSKAVVDKIGKEWEVHKAYIDWYLDSMDPFIRRTTKYGFDFLSSASCLNKRASEKFDKPTIIETDEERVRFGGKWIRN